MTHRVASPIHRKWLLRCPTPLTGWSIQRRGVSGPVRMDTSTAVCLLRNAVMPVG